MIFFIAVVLIFVAVSIYFFFKAESLQRELITKNRDNKTIKKENKVLVDAMALIANRYEEFAKYRLQSMVEEGLVDEKHIQIITPLVNNYAVIFIEAIKGKGRLKTLVQKCYENSTTTSFKDFETYIRSQNATIKRMWSNNNLNGFISLVEAFLQWTPEEKNKVKSAS